MGTQGSEKPAGWRVGLAVGLVCLVVGALAYGTDIGAVLLVVGTVAILGTAVHLLLTVGRGASPR